MDSSALPALLIPAAAAVAVRALFARRDARLREVVLAAVVGVAVPAGLHLADVRPSLPLKASEDAWQWLVWLVPAGALSGIVAAGRGPKAVRYALPACACGVTAALLLMPLGAGARLAFGTAGLLVLWGALARPCAEDRRRALSASVAVAVAAAPAILFRGAHSYQLALVAAVVGSAVLAAVLSLRGGVVPLARALCGVVTLGFGGVLLAANAYQRAGDADDFPAASALTLAAAAVAGVFVPARWGRTAGPAAAAGAALALAGVSAWTSGAFDTYEVWW